MRAELADYARAILRYLALLSVRSGFLYSILLHVLVFAVAVSDISFLSHQPIVISKPIPIELITIAARTNLPKPQVAPKPKPKREIVKKQTPPPAVQAPDAVPMPAPPKTKPAKKQMVAQVKPKPKPKPTAQKAKKPKFDIGRIAALINREKEDRPKAEVKPKDPNIKTPPISGSAKARDQPMTVSEIDAVKLQIRRCWILPAGANHAEGLVVKVRLFLHPDGSLSRQPEIVDAERMLKPGQEFYRAAAESAVRAVLKCEPLRMPAKKYERWREMVLTFDPSEMLGG